MAIITNMKDIIPRDKTKRIERELDNLLENDAQDKKGISGKSTNEIIHEACQKDEFLADYFNE